MNTRDKKRPLTKVQHHEIPKVPLRKVISAQELKKNVLRNIQNHSLPGKELVTKAKPDHPICTGGNAKIVPNNVLPKVLGRFMSFKDRRQENRIIKIAKTTNTKCEIIGRAISVLQQTEKVPSGKPKEHVEIPKPNVLPPKTVDLDVGILPDSIKYNEYASEVFGYLRSLEQSFTISKNFLQTQSETNSETRAELIDWIHRHASRFELYEETFYLTVAIIDLYLQSADITSSCLPLLGVTALLVASKYEEIKWPSLSQLVQMSQFRCTRTDIMHMERAVLKTLDFRVGRPVPIQFLRRYSEANNSGRLTHLLSKFFLELSLFHPELACLRPSLLAAAASCLSLWVVSDMTWPPHMEFCSGYSAEDVTLVTRDLAQYVQRFQTLKVEAVIKKFSGPAYMHVALFPQLLSIVKCFH